MRLSRKRCRFAQDYIDPAAGTMSRDNVATHIISARGRRKFKLSSGRRIKIPEESAPKIMENMD